MPFAFRKSPVQLQPHKAQYHNDLGCALRDASRYEEASRSFEKAIELQPYYTAAITNLAALKLDYFEDFQETANLCFGTRSW